MNRILRIAAVGLVGVTVVVLIFLGLRSALASGLQERLRGEDAFGVRIAILEDKHMPVLAQLALFPKKNQAFLIFLNTEARFPDDKVQVASMSPSSADNFERYTGIPNHYHLEITRANAVRLLDIGGGLPFFLEAPVFFKESRFQYPQGLELFSGMRLAEFALAQLRTKEEDELYTSIDRIYRTESVALSVIWRIKRLRAAFADARVARLGYSLVSTNMEAPEITALLDFLQEEAFTAVAEIPLEPGPARRRGFGDFVVKPDSARKLFAEYKDQLAGGTLRKETYPVELLNGTDTKGLAGRVKRLLNEQGPQVLTLGNYEYKPLAHSIILDRVGNTFGAASFSRKSGVKRDRVFFLRKASQVSLSLLIGNDFAVQQIEL